MNKPEIFLGIRFGLNWITDAEASTELKNHFLTQECTYPNTALMRHYIQEYADHSRDYLNRIFALQLKNLEYNPIENYDRNEEWSDSSNEKNEYRNQSDSDQYQYPMSVAGAADEKHTDRAVNDSTGKNESLGSTIHSGRVHGNIGVTTGAQMLQGEVDIANVIYMLNEQFCKQYDDLFMITV